MNRPSLIVLVGIPGAGKSHWVLEYLAGAHGLAERTVLVSTDAIREAVMDEYDHRYNAAIFMIGHVHAIKALERGNDVIFDATNLRRGSREELIEIARDHGAITTAVVFKTDFELAAARVAARAPDEQNAGISVAQMESFQASLERTLTEIAGEDWDEIVFTDGRGDGL